MPRAKRSSPGPEIDELVREYHRTKELALRDRLISQHLYLVQTVARKFSGLGESHDDLLQEGAMGLINAVDLYDPERGVQFSTYATHLVEGQIRHYLRDKGKLIKRPGLGARADDQDHEGDGGAHPGTGSRADAHGDRGPVGTTQQKIKEMLEAKERSKVASLDSGSDDDEAGPSIDTEKLRASETDGAHFGVEDRLFLRDSMSRLKTLEQRVVYHFFYLDLNQTEIARKLGISVNYASYLLRGALAKLKKNFEAQQAAAAQQAAVVTGPVPVAAHGARLEAPPLPGRGRPDDTDGDGGILPGAIEPGGGAGAALSAAVLGAAGGAGRRGGRGRHADRTRALLAYQRAQHRSGAFLTASSSASSSPTPAAKPPCWRNASCATWRDDCRRANPEARSASG